LIWLFARAIYRNLVTGIELLDPQQEVGSSHLIELEPQGRVVDFQ
jgi:hypothetical protein